MFWHHVRTRIVGSPLPSDKMGEKRLDNFRALAALSPDALASVAYANQEIFLALAVAGAAGLAYSWHIALVITSLLAILAVSYSQTIQAYPSGGGSYTVARENLGTLPGLVAAAALLSSYVLNAAVSLTAGVAALASAFPALWPHRTVLSLILLTMITIVNLRGLQEAGTVMVIPVYLYLVTFLGMIAFGVVVAVRDGPGVLVEAEPSAALPVTLFLLLRTFASGTTALTGVEAISNAVPVFRPPEPRHARQTMTAMAVLMGTLFLGTVGLTQYLAVSAGPDETILSALARRLFGSGPIYLLVQVATLLVLVVAANTSFAGFPRVTSLLGQDGFLPRQLKQLGDRLVFSNGILLLAGLAGLLIVVFGGDTHNLIPLFAIGAFLAFTLSQAGMVVHWLRSRERHWQLKAIMNGIGAVATAGALAIIGTSKFIEGAWIVIVLVPLVVVGFRTIRSHYDEVARELSLGNSKPDVQAVRPPRLIVPVASIHRGVIGALQYARSISDDVTAVHVEMEPGTAERLRTKWLEYGLESTARLITVPSPYRSYLDPFLAALDDLDSQANDGQLASVLIPEFVPAKGWQNILHNQTAWQLKVALLYRRHRLGKTRVIIDVPFHLKR